MSTDRAGRRPAGAPGARPPGVLHLDRGGTAVVLELRADSLPVVLHWGASLGRGRQDLSDLVRALRPGSTPESLWVADQPSVLPVASDGWLGRPAVAVCRPDGTGFALRGASVRHDVDGESVVSTLTDDVTGVELGTELRLEESGLLRVRATVRALTGALVVQGLTPCLPVPPAAAELMDMAGRSTRERALQRMPFTMGLHVREAHGTRPGHDAATLLCAGAPGFGFRAGRVWGVHVAWSGNHVVSAQHTFQGRRLLAGGELLLPGEVILAPGERYTSPWLVASWGEGLDALAGRFHGWLRARPGHPRRPRPVTLNTWEAVYFAHDPATLVALAERAARVGVERFVLDDGWFRGRRHDRAGLGDWYVDEEVWPDGLAPLADRVRALGMEMGLWVEPEAVSPDSDLARAHPDWVLDDGHGPGRLHRHQRTLDLSVPECRAYLLERLSRLVGDLGLAYLKWDHNSPVLDPGHPGSGRAAAHDQTLALYALLDRLRAEHPGLEIETSAGGGGRLDLEILQRTDRVWASDSLDPHERQDIQRSTFLLVPPELVGTHVGAARAHTTGRTHDLPTRAATALWGHLGIETDLLTLDGGELDRLGEWVALHKRLRPLLHSGTLVHADVPDPTLRVEGVVGRGRRLALFQIVSRGRGPALSLGPVPLPGLDARRRYRVRPASAVVGARSRPAWTTAEGVVLTGAALAEVGVAVPVLDPDHVLLVLLTAEEP